jgi:hypothetical protein
VTDVALDPSHLATDQRSHAYIHRASATAEGLTETTWRALTKSDGREPEDEPPTAWLLTTAHVGLASSRRRRLWIPPKYGVPSRGRAGPKAGVGFALDLRGRILEEGVERSYRSRATYIVASKPEPPAPGERRRSPGARRRSLGFLLARSAPFAHYWTMPSITFGAAVTVGMVPKYSESEALLGSCRPPDGSVNGVSVIDEHWAAPLPRLLRRI